MKNLMKALADFQQECPTILKKTEGYGYKYADLPSIMEVVTPLLYKHGLVLSQPLIMENGIRCVHTILFHIESGEQLESKMEIPAVSLKGMNDFQVLGSGITYIRRYELSILGIVTDEDTDAAGEQTVRVESNAPRLLNSDNVKYVAKELPWLSQKQFEAAVKRIQEANPNVHITEDGNDLELTPDDFLDKLTSGFRMKKDFKEALKTEIAFQKTLLSAPEKPQDVDIPIEPTIPY